MTRGRTPCLASGSGRLVSPTSGPSRAPRPEVVAPLPLSTSSRPAPSPAHQEPEGPSFPAPPSSSPPTPPPSLGNATSATRAGQGPREGRHPPAPEHQHIPAPRPLCAPFLSGVKLCAQPVSKQTQVGRGIHSPPAGVGGPSTSVPGSRVRGRPD